MADEIAETTHEETEDTVWREEPQGAGTDWKAEARKWESRAKENRRQLDELTQTLDGYKADADRKAEEEKGAAETIDELKRQLAQARAEAERERLVREVAKATGADADVLLRMMGDDEEAVRANAELLIAASKPRWPSAPDDGADAKAPLITREEILAIKNPRKQLEVAKAHPEAFRKRG